MGRILTIGLGGFLGSVTRYFLSGCVQQWTGSVEFPYGTLAVNVTGCFIVGILSQLMESHGAFNPETRNFLFVGVLGGFTTFSTFGNETINLLRDGDNFLASLNVIAHLTLAIGAAWFGRVVAEILWR